MAKPPNDPSLLNKQALKQEALNHLQGDVDAVAQSDVSATEEVRMGCVVDVQHQDGRRVRHFILPASSSITVGKTVHAAQLLSASSDLARALMGKRAGDAVDVMIKGKASTLTILGVA